MPENPPLPGTLFENLVVIDVVKHAHDRAEVPDLHFFRDGNPRGGDLVVGQGMPPGQLGLVEIKAGMTV